MFITILVDLSAVADVIKQVYFLENNNLKGKMWNKAVGLVLHHGGPVYDWI